MALIAEFSLPSEGFALADALSDRPDVVVEAGKLVAHSPDTTMPCLWVTGDDPGAFGEALADDPTVDRIEATAAFEEEVLYHVQWSDEVSTTVEQMVDHQGAVLAATAHDERWHVRLRFMTREQFEAFQETIEDWKLELRLEQLFTVDAPRQERNAVTADQRRALVAATEAGYYDVPRSTSIESVADDLSVSHQAVSERLRCGTANLVQDALIGTPGAADHVDQHSDGPAEDTDDGTIDPNETDLEQAELEDDE